MKKFNFKNKREYLNKKKSSDAAGRGDSGARQVKSTLESNWKNYEEDANQEQNEATEELNFNELLEDSSKTIIKIIFVC